MLIFNLTIKTFSIFDPLEQFDIYSFFSDFIFLLPTNINVALFANLIILCLFFLLSQHEFTFVKFNNEFRTISVFKQNYNVFKFILIKLFILVQKIIGDNIFLKKKSFFLLLYFLFFFILICNLIGMIPFSYTVTSSLIVTFFLSSSFFIGLNILGFWVNNILIFQLFLPSGVPFVISIFLILIEFISYISRVFSLAIRLFANMLSGHALLKILVGFS
jgi:ATP synthase subunit 6